MRPTIWVPISLFLGGVALIAFAVASGEAEVSLLLIFPVFSGSSLTFLLGTLLIVLSFVAGFVMLAVSQSEVDRRLAETSGPAQIEPSPPKTQYGGVVLIGPIPIAFGSSKKMALTMLVIGIVLVLIFIGLFFAL